MIVESREVGHVQQNGDAASPSGIAPGRGVTGSRGGPIAELEDAAGNGPPPRHIDLETAMLDRLARSWIDVQQLRKSLAQRELDEAIVDAFAAAEVKLSNKLSRTLRAHSLWPWLSQFPGLGGAHTALVIGRIGDPRRYPGQRCSEGHYLPPLYGVGSDCPVIASSPADEASNDDGDYAGTSGGAVVVEGEGACPGVMLEARTTTGVRSLWHWAGLHVDDDGCAPRKRKGQRCSWEPRVRASVMQPGGIAEQIVRQSVPFYSDLYRVEKERLMLRVPESGIETEGRNGDAALRVSGRAGDIEKENGGSLLCAADPSLEFKRPIGGASSRAPDPTAGLEGLVGRPLRRFEADRIARKIAAKAFLADLLTIWKQLA